MPPTSDKRRVQNIDFYAKTASGVKIHPIEIEYITSRYNKSAEIYVLGLSEGGKVPDKGEGSALYSENAGLGRDDLSIGQDTGEGEDLIIGRGAIAESWQSPEGLVGFVAYDGIRKMKSRKFKTNYGNNGKGGKNVGEPPEEVAKDIFKRSGVRHNIDVEFDPDDEITRNRANIPEGALDDINISINFNTNCADAMDKLSQHSSGGWYFNHKNQGIYTNNPDSVMHNVSGILDDSSGGQDLPYTKVKVYGSRENPQSGMIANDPVIGTAGKGKPVYKTTVNSIHNDNQAKVLAEQIMLEFRRQKSTGKIKMIGDEYIRPLDGISLPDHAGGGDYLVGGVTHRINSDEGFITEIDCNGFVGLNKKNLPKRTRDLNN